MLPQPLHNPKVSQTGLRNRIWAESEQSRDHFFGFEFCSIYRSHSWKNLPLIWVIFVQGFWWADGGPEASGIVIGRFRVIKDHVETSGEFLGGVCAPWSTFTAPSRSKFRRNSSDLLCWSFKDTLIKVFLDPPSVVEHSKVISIRSANVS